MERSGYTDSGDLVDTFALTYWVVVSVATVVAATWMGWGYWLGILLVISVAIGWQAMITHMIVGMPGTCSGELRKTEKGSRGVRFGALYAVAYIGILVLLVLPLRVMPDHWGFISIILAFAAPVAAVILVEIGVGAYLSRRKDGMNVQKSCDPRDGG
jgi:hypothetical protein